MAIVNLTPDSFHAPSRAAGVGDALRRMREFSARGASIIDIGAVSTRPGAPDVTPEEEWSRLEPVLRELSRTERNFEVSIDTTRSAIVGRAAALIGKIIVNDISSGEDDPGMLPAVADLGLTYIAMHKRGNPRSMDGLCDYPQGVTEAILDYFRAFTLKAEALGIADWVLDPGLGFAKTEEQNWQLLRELSRFKEFGRPVLIGAADKRFTRNVPPDLQERFPGLDGTSVAHALAVENGADILRVHYI